jgi:hypothetical protein
MWRQGARVYWLSLKTKVDGFSVIWAQKHRDNFSQFDIKTGGDGFFRFGLKIGGFGIPGLGIKISVAVSWFGPQPNGLWFVGCATKPMGGWRRCGTRIEI